MSAGYSGTPLAKKLGITAGMRVTALGAPADYATLVAPLPDGVVIRRTRRGAADLVHLFVTARDALDEALPRLRETLSAEVPVWVSWPKKASRVPTDVTEDVIRAVALPLGFVDVKVCAVDATWSGRPCA